MVIILAAGNPDCSYCAIWNLFLAALKRNFEYPEFVHIAQESEQAILVLLGPFADTTYRREGERESQSDC